MFYKLLALFSCTILFSAAHLSGQQVNFAAAESQLVELTTLVLTDHDREHRVNACDSAQELLSEILASPGSFKYPFSKLETMSVLTDSSGKFRIFTGQLFIDDSTYQYYGGIQLNKGEMPEYIPFSDASQTIEDINYDILDTDQWPGALYYNMMHFTGAKGEGWLLFGYNAHSFFNKRKIIEVLHFEADRPVFGGPYFEKRDDLGVPIVYNRIILTYSADASVSLNYDPIEGMVVYDHLTESKGIYPGQGNSSVPDGSYSGYKLDDGIWVYQEQLAVTPQDEPLRASPDSGEKRSGLFAPGTTPLPKKKHKRN